MSQPAVLSSAALRDIVAELRWIGPDNVLRAKAFQQAIRDAAYRLGERPLLGRTHPMFQAPRLRIWSIPKIQALLIYDCTTAPPQILRMFSTARDLGPLIAGLE